MTATDAAQSFTAADWLDFAAHLHPVLLHLPIGLLVAVVMVEAWSLARPDSPGLRRGMSVVFACTALAAAASGWLLGRGEEYAGELVDRHRILGLVAAALATAVALLDLFGRSGATAFLRRALLAACAVVVVVAGHDGGSLTHGRGFLADVAPPSIARWLPGSQSPDRASGSGSGDVAVVLAALEARCFECHGPDKAKGGLRLDTPDGLGSVVVAGAPAESEILRRVHLPREDEDAMPPSGAALYPTAVDALERWIEAGAALEALGQMHAAAAASEAELDAWRATTGARIEAAADGRGATALTVDWSAAMEGPTPEQLAALAPLAARTVELRLAGRPVGDAELEALPPLPALTDAHLERTPLGDAGLATLANRAPALRDVNLHSTHVTKLGLASLADLPALERVVLFGTGVAAADAAALGAQRPGLRVVHDAELPADPFGARQPRRILAADASKRRIALLREVTIGAPELLWEHPIEAIHDLQWLGDTSAGHGRVLFQDSWTRVLEVDTASGEVLWSYDAAAAEDSPVEVHSFRRLADGRTMVAESGRARIVFVDAAGAIASTVALTVETPSLHHDTRLVRPTDSGTFLVAHELEGVVREYAEDGSVVWEYRVPLFDRERAPGHGPDAHGNQVFAAVRAANGDTLVTTGNGSSLLRVRPNGSLRWHLGQDDVPDVPGLRLGWTTVVQELTSGNLALGNCHAGPDAPQILELTAGGELVWSFGDQELFGDALSNFEVVEEAR